MAILNRNTSELPESQVEYRDTNGARQWIALVLYILMALIVAVLVVLAGRWVYHKVHNSSETKSPSTTQEASPAQLASPNSSSSSTSPTPTSPPSSTATPSPAPTPAPNPSTLPNNGPGQVVALFAGTSLIAAGLHYFVGQRRLSNEQ
jgi:cytoskeletal protein RodZ